MISSELAQLARASAVRMVASGKASHVGSSLSMIDILSVLYSGVADVSASNINSPLRDVVIVSKGHAAAGTYAVLGHAGFFPETWFEEFCIDGGRLTGHVTAGTVPGIELSTGSLGHGLAFGSGVAISAQRDGNKRRIFVLMSDGECDEGSVWETALFASHHNLNNLTAIIDRNGLQSFGSTESTLALEPLGAKWEAFGWQVLHVDGHDHPSLRGALESLGNQPNVIVADTIKGKGVSFMEGQVAWHYKSPDDVELGRALSELASE